MELFYNNKAAISELDELCKTAANETTLTHLYHTTSNLLVHGDNLQALLALLPLYEGKIDLIYIDPPYNTGNDFFISNDGKASTFSTDRDKVAYKDKKPFDLYLEEIRQRLYVLHRLLSDEGSIYVHIDCKVGHYIKIIMDEIFGSENFINDIARIKVSPKNFKRKGYGNIRDMVLFYSKKPRNNIWNDIKAPDNPIKMLKLYPKVDEHGRRYASHSLSAPGATKNGSTGQPWRGIKPATGRHWAYTHDKLDELEAQGKIEWSKNGKPSLKKYMDEHEGQRIQDVWEYKDPTRNLNYPTQKNAFMLEQIIRQSSREDSIVLDCYAGSGSTLQAAVLLNRQWIGIDQSEEAIKTIKDHLDNYELITL